MRRKRQGVFYGWWIVAAGSAVSIFNSMTYFYGLSVFYKRIIDDFGWTRAQLAGAISLSRLESGLLGGLDGLLVDRFGPRPVMPVGVTFMSLGFVMLSRTNSLLYFYLIFIGFVAIGEGLGYVSIDTTVANWFIKRRGRAFGFLRGAVGLGAAGVSLLAWFITQYGWRTAFVGTGIGMFTLGIPAALTMKRGPEHYGMLPDGETREERVSQEAGGAEGATGASSPGASGPEGEADIGMGPIQALKTQAFWAISFGFAIRMMVTGAVALHAIPLVEDLGYSKATAAAVLGSIGMVSLIGRLGGGWLCDLLGTKRVAVATVLTLAISCLIIAYAQSLWMVMLFVAIYAPSYGASVVAMPAMRADHFGRRAFGTITGLSGMIQMMGMVIGPFFAAYVYDATGSYQVAFLVFAALSLVSAAMFSTLKRPRYR